ncbi:MAG: cell division protein FtsW, partial [Lachnospiraceae bacterium]|nr:cell division protein FtsW [Lachnospiraceae bacterium]
MSVEQAVKRGRKKNRTEYIDYTLLVIIIILMAFGFVMLYSTSAYMATLKYGNSIYYLKKQMMAAGLGA